MQYHVRVHQMMNTKFIWHFGSFWNKKKKSNMMILSMLSNCTFFIIYEVNQWKMRMK
jgi:hypothetical protein